MNNYWQTYGRMTIIGSMLGLLLALDDLFSRPLAFISGIPQTALEQYVTGAFGLVLTLLVSRFVRNDILNGMVARKSGKPLPQLVIDLTGLLILFIGICIIFSVVFKKDITGLVATGGVSVMVIGLALRDMLLAAFTGVLINIEKPFKIGDLVKINDKWMGKVDRITWHTTSLITLEEEMLIIPNLMLSNAVIVNLAAPDARMKRSLEVVIDYDTSVDSAERILYAAMLGAVGVTLTGSPTVTAIRMERDGVIYKISYTIANYAERVKSDHVIIKNILKCMRDAGITVSFPKTEVIHTPRRALIADRSLDTLRLVQQCTIFQDLPAAVLERVAGMLIERHFTANALIVSAGERRHSLFIVGEGMAKRTMTDRDGVRMVSERFIATESFGRRALFCCQPQVATVVAETAVLVYEFGRQALATVLADDPSLLDSFAHSLALLAWRESKDSVVGVDPEPATIQRLTNLYRGQIHAAYRLKASINETTDGLSTVEIHKSH
ncbi:MAG: mechanosensitive ion channel family protein [Magnetococcales bacterium]|nr:mechanosensitive ion channel family protein [Magnetococcales bacterium]